MKAFLLIFLLLPLALQAQTPFNPTTDGLQASVQVDQLLQQAKKKYQPYLAARGINLIMRNLWQDNSIGASAFRRGNNWFVNINGGMARHPQMTSDGLLAVVCHEIGHHLAGAPINRGFNNWSSVEGQSDYFATFKCLKLILSEENNVALVDELSLPEIVRQDCSAKYILSNYYLCLRLALASLSAVRVQEARSNKPFTSQFETPDTSVINRTFSGHNSPQCRLDTLYAGLLCDKDYNQVFSLSNEDNCLRSQGYRLESRPTCWYKP